jgi:hypothetical protein
MRKNVAVALLVVSTGLSGCVFAVGTASEGDRIRKLEQRVERAERALHLDAPQEPAK